MPQVKHFGVREDSFELFTQADLHLFLIDKDAVLSQTARFDVAVEQNDSMAGFSKLAGGVDTRWARPDNGYQMLMAHSVLVKRASFGRTDREETKLEETAKLLKLSFSFVFQFGAARV